MISYIYRSKRVNITKTGPKNGTQKIYSDLVYICKKKYKKIWFEITKKITTVTSLLFYM